METDKKETPIFFFNNNKDPDPDMKGHYVLTQFKTLLLAILITGLMQLSNHLALYLIYCCPIYFLIVIIQYFAFWKPDQDLTIQFNFYNGIMFIICFPIFFGVFFGVFHPTASIEFTKVQNCQMVGSLTKWIEQTEKYSILYVNFDYEGKQYLGQACASDFSQEKTASPIAPYKFYYKYDGIICGPSDTNNTDPQYPQARLLSKNYLNQTDLSSQERVLRVGGGGGRGGGGSSGGRSSGSRSSSTSSCTRAYKWSKVKIASWMCMDRDFDIEDFMEPQPCYVNFFTADRAVQNGQNRVPMRNTYNFPMISYSEHSYYPKADIVCLVIFTYYNWILAFNSIFQYTSNYLLKRFRRTTRQNQLVVPAFLSQPNPDPIQMEQINKEVQNIQPNLDQVDQQPCNNNKIDFIPSTQLQVIHMYPAQIYPQQQNSPQLIQSPAYIIGTALPPIQPNQNNGDNTDQPFSKFGGLPVNPML